MTGEPDFEVVAEAWRFWLRWNHGVDVPLTANDAATMQGLTRFVLPPPHPSATSLERLAYLAPAMGDYP